MYMHLEEAGTLFVGRINLKTEWAGSAACALVKKANLLDKVAEQIGAGWGK